MHIIEAKNLSYIYPDGTKALEDINFKAGRGECIALLGANGAGKSTLLKHFNGILKPTSGVVLIKGEPITKRNIIEVRKTIGLVFQDPDDQIFAPTVKQDVAFGPVNLGLSKEVIEHRVSEALKLVGLEGYENRVPHHLSGGEKKRVAIAGILAMEPQVLILDEPTAGLDPDGVKKIIKLLKDLNDKFGITIIVATHDVDTVPLFADRICILSKGRLILDGTPREVFSKSKVLEESSLDLPVVTKLFKILSENGIPCLNTPLTIGEAKEELLHLLAMRK
ncbi:MAG: ATP-binding cassette domain-containing protein [Methanocellales archaeon]